MAERKYKSWVCEVVVPADAKLPKGFDGLMRAAIDEVILARNDCLSEAHVFSGWGNVPTEAMVATIEDRRAQHDAMMRTDVKLAARSLLDFIDSHGGIGSPELAKHVEVLRDALKYHGKWP